VAATKIYTARATASQCIRLPTAGLTPATRERRAAWHGKPISGRYSFTDDSKGFIESITNKAPTKVFPSQAARRFAGSLPHHNEIAVDEAGGGHSNRQYSEKEYKAQFQLRYRLALQHITEALAAHPKL